MSQKLCRNHIKASAWKPWDKWGASSRKVRYDARNISVCLKNSEEDQRPLPKSCLRHHCSKDQWSLLLSKEHRGLSNARKSYVTLDNVKTPAQTRFKDQVFWDQKESPESLTWKKALEKRSTNIRPGAVGRSNYQERNKPTERAFSALLPSWSCRISKVWTFSRAKLNLCDDSTPSQKFTMKSFHENKPDGKYGLIDNQDPAPSMSSPVDRVKQQKPNILQNSLPSSPAQRSPRPYSVPRASSQPVESEARFISINCYPSPNSDSSSFGLRSNQTNRQRANISEHQHYSTILEPVEPIQKSQIQPGSTLSEELRWEFANQIMVRLLKKHRIWVFHLYLLESPFCILLVCI